MKVAIKDIFLKKKMNSLNIYMIYLIIYHFYQKEQNLINPKYLYEIFMIKKYVAHSKTSIKSWIYFEKSAQTNSIISKSMAKLYLDMNI